MLSGTLIDGETQVCLYIVRCTFIFNSSKEILVSVRYLFGKLIMTRSCTWEIERGREVKEIVMRSKCTNSRQIMNKKKREEKEKEGEEEEYE